MLFITLREMSAAKIMFFSGGSIKGRFMIYLGKKESAVGEEKNNKMPERRKIYNS